MIDDLIANGDLEVAWDLCEERGWFLDPGHTIGRSWQRGVTESWSSHYPLCWAFMQGLRGRTRTGKSYVARVRRRYDMAVTGPLVITMANWLS